MDNLVPVPPYQYLAPVPTQAGEAVSMPPDLAARSSHPQSAHADLKPGHSNHNIGGLFMDNGGQSSQDGGKKRKKVISAHGHGAEGEAKVKKTRQSQSCDACRARKVKCDRPPPGSSNTDVPTRDVCSHCAQLQLPCRFDYVPRKRGPPNMYLKRMQEDQDATGDDPNTSLSSHPHLHHSSSPVLGIPGLDIPSIVTQGPLQRQANISNNAQLMSDMRPPNWQPSLAVPMPPAQIPHVQQYTPSIPFSNGASPMSKARLMPPAQPSPGGYLPQTLDAAYSLVPSQSSPSGQSSPMHVPPITYIQHTHNPRNPLDSVIPRPLLYRVIELYFDYIYCLIPSLHKPSFIHDLNIKREEKPEEEEWVALVLAVVVSTLVQLPKSFVDMPRKEVKETVLRCHGRVREYLTKDFETVTVTRTIILYHSIFIYGLTSRLVMARSEFGTNYAILMDMRAHEESSYARYGPIESALRRRTYWLAYGADKTWSAINGWPSLFHEDDCASVALPDETDDEYLTEEGATGQPEGYTPVMCGFRYISKIHRLTGEILDKKRRDKLNPPSGLELQLRLNEINNLYHQAMVITDDCPPPLKLDFRSYGSSVASLSPDWSEKMKDDIRVMLTNPNGSDMELVKDFYLVQQANIYVTQQLVRLVLIQYRDDILQIQWIAEHGAGDDPQAVKAIIREQSQSQRDEVIIDLLAILQKIPVKVLAVNSFSIVIKVRFVASTLLEFIYPEGTESGAQITPNFEPPLTGKETRNEKAQRNLWVFLNILSRIEAMYSWAEDEDAS